ncbi:uncharacterized protein LOC112045397 [Bicyclus anynana]|uniref:Uncharacterized protein LOC112045397 n=1 Tax=Bicyclus anynana TaxID=110368 RepID=A0A6J1MP40_BICAN|nr:uncharacterized protein LOC112045397 [Bicyclus anynana]
MVITRNSIFLLCFFRVFFCAEPVVDSDGVPYLAEVKEEEVFPSDVENEILNATLFRTIKKYYCSVETEEEQELLVYGTKAWTFPSQDVNLQFRYPPEEQTDPQGDEDSTVYMLTQLKLIFNLSGPDGRGYITSGGMLQEHIGMSFVFRNITSLAYQFYLHGIPRKTNFTENYAVTLNLC